VKALFVVTLRDGTKYGIYESKLDAKAARDLCDPREKARVSRGPDHWRGPSAQ
jgi:hypothetical protein